MSTEKNISFFFDEVSFRLQNRRKLKAFIAGKIKKAGYRLESLSYIFSTDSKVLSINQEFLKHNTFTDIITFNLAEGKSIEAEIYVSVERVRENSKIHQVSFNSELHRVIFHGVLHLLGHKDKASDQKAQMRKAEDQWLKSYL